MERSRKIITLDQAEAATAAAREAGETVVLCHGCFDIVHPGHVRHLQQARRLGNRLLVTITGDALVDKDTGRPLIPQELRAENLAALDCVDWVAVNPAPTAVALLDRLRPDVYVKGREYQDNRDPRFEAEKAAVERYGGRLVFTSGDVVFSSTALIAEMQRTASPGNGRLVRLLEQERLDETRADELVASFRGRRIAVVGETIVDTYVMCDRPEVAAEGPMMTLRPLEHRSFDGGAAIIARHLAAMGARPCLVTVLPASDDALALVQRLADEGVECRVVRHAGSIAEKRRFLVGTSKVMKLDLSRPITLDAEHDRRVLDETRHAAREAEALIVADFGQGLFSSTTLADLCAAVRPEVDLLVGDVSGFRSNLGAMSGMDLLCPSESEIRDAFHDYNDGLSAVVWKLLHATSSRSAIVTLGGDGAAAFEGPEDATLEIDDWQTRLATEFVPALAPYALDQLGCGDALLAAATLTRAAGGSLTLATLLGEIAAAAQSQRLGNAVIDAAELRRGVRRMLASQLIVDREAAAVSTPGDQLHPAHA